MYFFTIGLLLAVSVLSVTFGIMMYSTNLMDTYRSLIRTDLTDTIQKIQYGVSFGKTIDNYFGVTTLLQENVENSEYIENLYVTKAEEGLLYQTGDAAMPETILGMEAGTRAISQDQFYAVFSLTEDSLLVAQMGTEQIDSQRQDFMVRLVLVTIMGVLLILVLISILWWHMGGIESVRRIPLCMVVIWIVMLGIYVGIMCWREYLGSQDRMSQGVEKSVMADVERLEEQGIPQEELVDVDGYLRLYLENIPELEDLRMEDGQLVYRISQKNMQITFIQYVLNTVLLSIISVLIVVEYQLFLGMRKQEQKEDYSEWSNRMVRLAVFFLYACINIGKSMNAVVSKRLALELTERSVDMLTSVPATTAMLGSVLGILCSKWITERAGNLHRYFMVISACAVIGLAACGISEDLYLFAAARAIVGFGEGLLLIGIKNYAFRFTFSSERTRALSYVTGGGFGGVCLGSVIGGMLCDHLSYRHVFLIAAGCVLAVIPLTSKIQVSMAGESGASGSQLFAVFRNLKAVRYLVFLVFPVYAAAVFLDYVLPLAGEGFGFSHSEVSALMLANCLIAGYAAPFMTRIVMKKMSPEKGTFLYCALYGGIILLYAVTGNPAVLVFVIIALGLCDSFGLMMIAEGFALTKGNSNYLDSEANILFAMTSRAGQLAAPLCVAWFGNSAVLTAVIAAGLGGYKITAWAAKKGGR